MASLNHCSFIGNLGRDPETRFFSNGDKITNASIACTESWKDKTSGEKKERTEWVNLVFTGGLADVAEKYLRKGSQIHVSGKFTTRKWQDKEGVDRYSTEIRVGDMVMLSKAPGQQDQGGGQPATTSQRPASASAAQQRPAQRGGAVPAQNDMGDDIPFIFAEYRADTPTGLARRMSRYFAR